MKKQSREDQEKRLSDLRCPVHGLGLCQIDEDYNMECPRRDCHIKFKMPEEHQVIAEMPDRVLTATVPYEEL